MSSAGAPEETRPRLVVERELDRENRYRGMLGLAPLGHRLAANVRLWAWLGPLLMMMLGGMLRLANLDHPAELVFDETYYVKDAFTLDQYGYATQWEPDDEEEGPNANFVAGAYHEMTDDPAYVVHGDVGKWLIALGMRLFGADTGLGWRFAVAIAGTLTILLVGRIAYRLFRSALLATAAAAFIALDGVSITHSRTALLDGFLTLFVLVGFWALLKDRELSRARLATRYARARNPFADPWGPPTGVRWWMVVAGIALGVAAGVKWSGLYAAAAFGITAFLWEVQARRAAGARLWIGAGVFRGGMPAFLALVPTTILTYVATWFSWFRAENSYLRQWAAERRASGEDLPRAWLPDSLNSFVEYHLQMLRFHSNLDSEHSYMASPLGWLLQIRPTSFYWRDLTKEGVDVDCGADRCVQAITSVGNPVLWWAGFLALALVLWMAFRRGDWRAQAIVAGYAGTYLPWFLFLDRTVFTFYTVVIAPFVALAVTYALGLMSHRLPLYDPADPSGRAGPAWLALRVPILSRSEGRRRRRPALRRLTPAVSRRVGVVTFAVVVGLLVLLAALWWPIWTALTVPYWFWHLHMWMPSWV